MTPTPTIEFVAYSSETDAPFVPLPRSAILLPAAPEPGTVPVDDIAAHLLEHHHRDHDELMHESGLLLALHRFEHFEATLELVAVDHRH